MAKTQNYGKETRERAVRLVREHAGDYPSEFAAIKAVAARLGIGSPETVRKWLRRAQVDAGERPGTTTEEKAEIRRSLYGLHAVLKLHTEQEEESYLSLGDEVAEPAEA